MQLAIKNKWISVGGSSTVQDVNGNDVLRVQGAVFSLTRKKILMTLVRILARTPWIATGMTRRSVMLQKVLVIQI